MNRLDKFVLFLMFVLFLSIVASGCAGKHCIKVGGTYEGNSGELEYCYEKEVSKSVGLPILSNESGQSVILSEKQIGKLLEKVDTEKKMTEKIGIMKRLFDLVR